MIKKSSHFFLLLLMLLPNWGYSKQIDLSADEVVVHQQELLAGKTKKFFQQIKLVKYFLINGDVERAKQELNKTEYVNKHLYRILIRMEALIAFLNNDFEKSYALLNRKFFQQHLSVMAQVCTIQLFNMLALKKYETIEKYFDMCRNAQLKNSVNQLLWVKDTIDLLKYRKRITSGNFLKLKNEYFYNVDFLRAWLKEALYNNQENIILKDLRKIPQKSYHNKEIRELLAYIYYRVNDIEQARKFLKNIHTTNAENIRGNIYLKEKKYELAFAHFKLALKYKKNSLNAIERLIPLAWLLEKHQESINILNAYNAKKIDPIKKNTLLIAHLLKTKNFKEAAKILEKVNAMHIHQMPHILNLMAMYTYLMLKNKTEMQKYATLACKEYDGLSCWLMMQSQIWNNITAFLNDPKIIAPNAQYELEQLKQPQKITPLKENVIINQSELEEIDFGFYHKN